jgi:hypothetical protein
LSIIKRIEVVVKTIVMDDMSFLPKRLDDTVGKKVLPEIALVPQIGAGCPRRDGNGMLIPKPI